MLACIDPADRTDYDGWLEVGMALHHTDPGLLDVWVNWSGQMPNFDAQECLDKWESFAGNYKGPKTTIRSLHHWAKQGGYVEPKRSAVESRPQHIVDEELLPLHERIDNRIKELLDAHLINSASKIDATSLS